MRYTVLETEYASRAALRKEWRGRCAKYSKDGEDVSEVDRRWFVSAAYASGTHRRYLCGDSIEACLLTTKVLTDRVGRCFRGGKRKLSRRMRDQRCIFFAHVDRPDEVRAVPGTLGETPRAREKTKVTAWMRKSIQEQINDYRQKRKVQSHLHASGDHLPYNCDICGCCCRNRENHVDHGVGEHSFKAILKDFEADVIGREIGATDIAGRQAGRLRTKWQKFHGERARLSLTCRKCNLQNK